MKKTCVVMIVLLLAGCSDRPQESYAQKIDRYELEVGKRAVAYFSDQAEMYAKQPIKPVLIDTPSNYETPKIFMESRSGLTQHPPQTNPVTTGTEQN